MFLTKIFTCRLVRPTTVLSFVKVECFKRNVKSSLSTENTLKYITNFRNMSQKSIKSFFKITPKKTETAVEKQEETSILDTSNSSEINKVPNGNNKRSKRLRSSSSENECPKIKKKTPSPVSSEKNKKIKRQRIESSESETERPGLSSNEDESPKIEKKTLLPVSIEEKKSKHQRIESSESETERPGLSSNEDESPKIEKKTPLPVSIEKKKSKHQRIESSESETESPKKEEQMEIKLEKSDKPPKTYASPKAKKTRVKQEPKKQLNIKKSPGTPNSKKNIKSPSPVKAQNNNKADKNETLMSKFAVKVEKVDKENSTNKENDIIDDGNIKLVNEVDYNPGKSKYHPVEDACWARSKPVPYSALAKTLEVIEATSARLKMVEILSNYFRSVTELTPEDLLPSIYLCLNRLAPAHMSVELGIAETYLMKAVGGCTGRSLAQVRAAAQRCGDLGLVAQQARTAQRMLAAPPRLTVRAVLAALRDVAAMTGQASVSKKISKIQSIYVACKNSEARYLIRSLEGKLRVGLAEQSLLQALALAAAARDRTQGSDVQYKALVDEYALIIKTTYCECPNYELVVPALLQHGVRALPDHCRLTPGLPLKPMLAHPTKGVHEVFNRFEGTVFTCEYKYDGERAQLHVPGDQAPDLQRATLYSRNQEDNTSKYPDILKRLPSLLKDTVTSCVLDCEAVAYDTTTKQILPFQVLSTRKRKDASEESIKVQVCVFVFDLLFLNGAALVREELTERRRLLREHFHEVEGEWQFAVSRDCTDEEEVGQFLQEAVRGSCEGLMVKALRGEHSRYDIARRSHNWLKLKKDYLEGVGDSIDAVVIGAYHGRGKRVGVYGGFLLACYDPAAEQYQSLCKIGTGFSDEDLRTLSETLAEHVIDGPRSYYMYDASHAPDAWFSPARVWEVRCADLSLSPAHRAAAGTVHPHKGISLRFPRFIRAREDKTPEQATSAEQLADLYLDQDQVKNAAAARGRADDFY